MNGNVNELSVRIDDAGGPVAREVHPRNIMAPPGGHIVILVHGFNNNKRTAERYYREFIRNLRTISSQTNAATIGGRPDFTGFFWPGDADLWVFSFISYPTEIPDAQNSARVLANFLSQVPGLQQISLIGHSLGCRLILEMLWCAAQGNVQRFPKVRFLLLAAAAVPVELVESGGRLRGGVVLADPVVVVLFSPHDLVLRGAFPAGQTLAYLMGYEPRIFTSAVGLHGQPPNFGAAHQQLDGAGHGDYWGSSTVAKDVITLLGAATPREIKAGVIANHQTQEHKLPNAHTTPEYDASG